MAKVKLHTNDNKMFEVDLKVAKCSNTLKIMLEDCGFGDNECPVIPLPNVNSKILPIILEWAERHADDEDSTSTASNELDDTSTENISEWDRNFITLNQAILHETLLAANYLDIRGLLTLCFKTVANMIKGKSPEEIRRTFGIANDFTPEEEEEVRKEFKWAEEH